MGRKNLFLLLLCYLAHGCSPQQMQSSFFVVRKQTAIDSTSPTSSVSDKVVWQDDRYQLLFMGDATVLRHQVLVMVSTKGSEEYQQLLDSYTTVAKIPGQGLYQEKMVLAVPRSADVDLLAFHAHQQSGAMCSPVRRLNLDNQNPLQTSSNTVDGTPYFVEHAQLQSVQSIVNDISATSIRSYVATITNETTRHHVQNSSYGTTLKTFVESNFGSWIDSASLVTHSGTDQQSLVVVKNGTDASNEVLVIGAHYDSIVTGTSSATAPGADDNASGVAAILEIIKRLSASDVNFHRTVEFHFYAAEEVGLVGSTDMANSYNSSQRNVLSMLNLDMTAYSAVADDTTIYLPTDNTSYGLRVSLQVLASRYLEGNIAVGTIGNGGTSDHESWYDAGFPSVFIFENPTAYNSRLHTLQDTLSSLDSIGSFELSAEMAKGATAFLAHHAGITSGDSEADSAREKSEANLSNDLNVAVIETSTTGQYVFAIATPTTIAETTICRIESATAVACSVAHELATSVGTRSNRKFFEVTRTLNLSSGNRYRIKGLDSNGSLVALREIRLDSKTN